MSLEAAYKQNNQPIAQGRPPRGLIVATVENSARPVEDLPPQSNLVDGATVHVPGE